MSLIEALATECRYKILTETDDGCGGTYSDWSNGDTFTAVIATDNSLEAKKAEKMGVSGFYTVSSQDVVLEYGDVFERLSDGQIFRVTSAGTDVTSPSVASFYFVQVTAEKWELTTDNEY